MFAVHTIGYSRRPLAGFIALLAAQGVELLCDVRSAPYSRFRPEFDRGRLAEGLAARGLNYRFVGDKLGGRSSAPESYVQGKLSYARSARLSSFRAGLADIARLSRQSPLALMCAEADPIDCHRAILVARHLRILVGEIRHIGRDDRVETGDDFERRLVALTNTAPPPLLASDSEAWARAVEEAYDRRSEKMTGIR